ncbi:MAG: hypothetical protein RIS18_523 [Actinomycetota bacterium]|jgi:hypothetical protein
MSASTPQPNSDSRGLRAVSINENPKQTGRWQKLIRRQWPTLVPLLIAFIGIVLATQLNFRVGALVFSLGVFVAAVLRASLPRFTLGWLYVRTKWVDVLILGSFSVFLLILSIVVPS